ncbi:DUF6538 domain-containing protein [Agrobacterium tumefaciens]|uniref:DUF6538 domain-containing protein n=1 Tax=Agrobacterium tumefaciens TaxID=358 RepID=UPI003BA2AC1C
MTRPYLNGTTYWLRKKVPDDLRPILGKTEEKKSLRTRDPAEAKIRFAKAIAEIEERWSRLRGELTELTPREAFSLAGELHREFVADRENNPRLSIQERHALEAGKVILGIAKFPTTYVDGTPLKLTPRQIRDRTYGEKQARDNADLINAFLIKRGLRLKDSSRKLFDDAVMHAVVMGRQVLVQRMNNNFGPHPEASRFPVLENRKLNSGVTPSSAETPGAVKLSDAIAEWVSEKSRKDGDWVKGSAEANELWAKRFQELVGDRPLTEYNKADARSFKKALRCLPPNFLQKEHFRKLDFTRAVEKAATAEFEPMSDRNVNKILGFVRAFWNWAEGEYDDVPPNPFRGMNLRIKTKARDERDPFTSEQLQTIFNAPLYTGCMSAKSYLTQGEHVPSGESIYWVPLIGLFTGARSGEIIQLRCDDVKFEAGIRYFDIRDDGEREQADLQQGLKTDSSVRTIPVHPILEELGIAAFVAHQRKKGQRLFPDFPKAVDGYYSTAFSPRFNRFLKNIGAKTEKVSFHSFRHSFEDACLNSRIPLEFTNALQGHSDGGMADRYGTGMVRVRLLNEEMQKLDYEGLDFSRLIAARADLRDAR